MRKERRWRIFTIARIEYFIAGEEGGGKDKGKIPRMYLKYSAHVSRDIAPGYCTFTLRDLQ